MLPVVEFLGVTFPTYFLWMSLISTGGGFWVYRNSLSQNLDARLALDFYILILVSGFFGSRIFHVIYELPNYYESRPLEIFKFWQGGFVYFGGMVLSFIFCWIYSWQKRVNFNVWLDFFTPIVSCGYILGRFGCFLSGCCYGERCDLPWGVTIPGIDIDDAIPRHPTQIYAMLAEIMALSLVFLTRRFSIFKFQGARFFVWVILHSVGRLIMETYRGDPRGSMIFGHSISSIIAVVLICLFGLVIRSRRLSARIEG